MKSSIYLTNIIENQIIYCKNKSLGCDWKGKIALYLQSHTECPKDIIICPNNDCQVIISRDEIKTHNDSCMFRQIPCEKCATTIIFIEIDLHSGFCPKEKAICPNDCGQTMLRHEIQHHIQTSCINKKIPCDFADFGCGETYIQKYLTQHLEEKIEFHTKIVLDFIMNNFTKINSILDNMESFCTGMNEKKKSYEEIISKIKVKYDDYFKQLELERQEKEKEKKALAFMSNDNNNNKNNPNAAHEENSNAANKTRLKQLNQVSSKSLANLANTNSLSIPPSQKETININISINKNNNNNILNIESSGNNSNLPSGHFNHLTSIFNNKENFHSFIQDKELLCQFKTNNNSNVNNINNNYQDSSANINNNNYEKTAAKSEKIIGKKTKRLKTKNNYTTNVEDTKIEEDEKYLEEKATKKPAESLKIDKTQKDKEKEKDKDKEKAIAEPNKNTNITPHVINITNKNINNLIENSIINSINNKKIQVNDKSELGPSLSLREKDSDLNQVPNKNFNSTNIEAGIKENQKKSVTGNSKAKKNNLNSKKDNNNNNSSNNNNNKNANPNPLPNLNTNSSNVNNNNNHANENSSNIPNLKPKISKKANEKTENQIGDMEINANNNSYLTHGNIKNHYNNNSLNLENKNKKNNILINNSNTNTSANAPSLPALASRIPIKPKPFGSSSGSESHSNAQSPFEDDAIRELKTSQNIFTYSKQLSFENSVITAGDFKNRDHLFFLIDDKEFSDKSKITIKILNSPLSFALGFCIKEIIYAGGLIFNEALVNHGYFIISSDSYLFHSNSSFMNNIKLKNFPMLKINDEILFQYNSIKGEMNVKINNRSNFVINKIFKLNNSQTIIPCLIFQNKGEKIKLEYCRD